MRQASAAAAVLLGAFLLSFALPVYDAFNHAVAGWQVALEVIQGLGQTDTLAGHLQMLAYTAANLLLPLVLIALALPGWSQRWLRGAAWALGALALHSSWLLTQEVQPGPGLQAGYFVWWAAQVGGTILAFRATSRRGPARSAAPAPIPSPR